MENKDRAILVLDNDSRNIIKTSVSAIGVAGIRFIDGLDELSDELMEYSHNVVILEGFFRRETCLSELELYKGLYKLNYFYLGSSKYFKVVEKIASCFECDIASIDYSTIIAALYGDVSQSVPDSVDYFSKIEMAKKIVDSEDSHQFEAVEVAKAYLADYNVYSVISKERNNLELEIEQLKNFNSKLSIDKSKLLSGYYDMIKETETLNKTLQRYEEIFTKDVYEKVRLHDYLHKPLIIYLKEFEDFLNLDQMIETIVSTIRLQDRKSVKVLRLFDSQTSRKMVTLPEYYTVLRNRYLMADVLASDFLCKSGDYRKVLDKILLNETGLDVLIVIDSKSYDDVVISGTALYINMCREPEHVDLYGLRSNNTIVNGGDPNSDWYWGYYNTDEMDNREKMVYLSSRPVIRNILELSRVFAQSL